MIRKIFRVLVYSMVVFNLFMILPLPGTHVDSNVLTHYDNYLSIVNKHCSIEQYDTSNHLVVVTNLPNKYLGLCTKHFSKYIIIFNKNDFDGLSETDKFQLVSHEMYHCLFDGEHSKSEYHYMYYGFISLPPELVRLQVEVDIMDRCK